MGGLLYQNGRVRPSIRGESGRFEAARIGRARAESEGERVNTHLYENSDPTGFDSNCAKCGGKARDSVHNLPMTLNETCAALQERDKAFFDDAFTNPVTKEPYDIPPDLRRLAARLCRSYGIRGCCDPMYIANIIALELGLGDGQSHFGKEQTT